MNGARWHAFFLVAALLLVAWLTVHVAKQSADCTRTGGVLVMGLYSYECVEAVKK